MKSNVMHVTVQLNEEAKQKLTQEVKETLATHANFIETEKRNFTTAEMWNRNRKGRYAGGIQRRWHLS